LGDTKQDDSNSNEMNSLLMHSNACQSFMNSPKAKDSLGNGSLNINSTVHETNEIVAPGLTEMKQTLPKVDVSIEDEPEETPHNPLPPIEEISDDSEDSELQCKQFVRIDPDQEFSYKTHLIDHGDGEQTKAGQLQATLEEDEMRDTSAIDFIDFNKIEKQTSETEIQLKAFKQKWWLINPVSKPKMIFDYLIAVLIVKADI
jgi:hypothetical protein